MRRGMRAAASTSAVRSERCGETASSKRSRPRCRAVRRSPRSPRSRPRLSSMSTSSTSGWPWCSGAASGRTSTERRRGASRARSADTRGVVSTTSPRKLVCATSSAGPSRPWVPPSGRGGPGEPPPNGSLEPLGFIDEHDRDVVLDPIAQLARPAYERVLRLGQDHLALALRAGEDLEQLLADGHGPSSSFSGPSSVNPPASTIALGFLSAGPRKPAAPSTRRSGRHEGYRVDMKRPPESRRPALEPPLEGWRRLRVGGYRIVFNYGK